MAGRYIRPSYQYFDNSNRILDSGKLYFYESGTTTLKNVYSDPDGLTAIANPVILNGAGRTPDVYLDGSYKLIITDKNDAQIEERDPVLAADDTTKGFAIWNAISIYEIDDIIRASNNLLYISISDSNQNNEPSATATKWTAVQLLGSYNANQTYFIGNVVIDSIGDIYRSRTNSNVGNTPASSPTDWTTVVAGAFSGNVTVGGTLGVTGVSTFSDDASVIKTGAALASRNSGGDGFVAGHDSGGTAASYMAVGASGTVAVGFHYERNSGTWTFGYGTTASGVDANPIMSGSSVSNTVQFAGATTAPNIPVVVKKASDEFRGTTTLSNDANLAKALLTGTDYLVDLTLAVSTDGPELKVAVNYSSSSFMSFEILAGGASSYIHNSSSRSVVGTSATNSSNVTALNSGWNTVQIRGLVRTTGAGTLSLQWAQATVDGTNDVYVLSGSTLEVVAV